MDILFFVSSLFLHVVVSYVKILDDLFDISGYLLAAVSVSTKSITCLSFVFLYRILLRFELELVIFLPYLFKPLNLYYSSNV